MFPERLCFQKCGGLGGYEWHDERLGPTKARQQRRTKESEQEANESHYSGCFRLATVKPKVPEQHYHRG